MSPTILTLHVLCEIAAEVHDPLLKSARAHSEERRVRDGAVRDHLRSNGDTKRVMEALEGLVERGMDNVGQPVWSEAVEWALRATCSWARKWLMSGGPLECNHLTAVCASYNSLGRHLHRHHPFLPLPLPTPRCPLILHAS